MIAAAWRLEILITILLILYQEMKSLYPLTTSNSVNLWWRDNKAYFSSFFP